jgi:hypothetical protein
MARASRSTGEEIRRTPATLAPLAPPLFDDYNAATRRERCRAPSLGRVGRMHQIIRELKRQFAGEKLAPEQLKALIRAGYVYRNGDEHLLTDKGRVALAQSGVDPGVTH